MKELRILKRIYSGKDLLGYMVTASDEPVRVPVKVERGKWVVRTIFGESILSKFQLYVLSRLNPGIQIMDTIGNPLSLFVKTEHSLFISETDILVNNHPERNLAILNDNDDNDYFGCKLSSQTPSPDFLRGYLMGEGLRDE